MRKFITDRWTKANLATLGRNSLCSSHPSSQIYRVESYGIHLLQTLSASTHGPRGKVLSFPLLGKAFLFAVSLRHWGPCQPHILLQVLPRPYVWHSFGKRERRGSKQSHIYHGFQMLGQSCWLALMYWFLLPCSLEIYITVLVEASLVFPGGSSSFPIDSYSLPW